MTKASDNNHSSSGQLQVNQKIKYSQFVSKPYVFLKTLDANYFLIPLSAPVVIRKSNERRLVAKT